MGTRLRNFINIDLADIKADNMDLRVVWAITEFEQLWKQFESLNQMLTRMEAEEDLGVCDSEEYKDLLDNHFKTMGNYLESLMDLITFHHNNPNI